MLINVKKNVKNFWKKHNDKIKIGGICLSIGMIIGYLEGENHDQNVNIRIFEQGDNGSLKEVPEMKQTEN